MKRRRHPYAIMAFSFAFLLSACGGGGSTTAPSTPAEPSAAASTEPSAAATTEPSAAADMGPVTFATYGSAFEEAQTKAFIEPFKAETGIEVRTDSPVDFAKLKVMVESGSPTWDVYLADQQQPPGACDVLFEKLDMTNINPADFAPGSVSECGVPVDTYGYLVAYNKDKYGTNPPTSIKDFFDTAKFPGVRAVSNYPAEGTLELALLADGVPKDQLYPIDYDRAFKVMDRIKDGLVFWESGAEQVEAMEAKRVDMILVWSGRGFEAVTNGAPFVPMWQDSSFHWASLAIVKGTSNKEAAQKFVDFAVSPGPQAAFAEQIAYGAANLKATPKMDPTRTDWDASVPEHLAVAWSIDNDWWAAHEAEVYEKWTAWTSG